MKKPLKLALIIGGSILVAVIAVFAILKGFEPTVGSKYYAIFYYQTGGYGNEASQHRAICIECTPGDTITFPEPEGIQQGYEFEGYRLSKMNAYGEEVFMPGDTLQTSSEMFEIFDAVSPGGSLWLANDCVINNDTDSICNIYAICYDGSFLLGDYTVTLHNFEMVESEPIEYNLHSAKEVYQTVAYRLCSRYREGAVIQDIYVDGYKLEGLYLDEGFTIPYTSTSANGTDLDIYAKWVYAGLFFTNEMGEMTLSKIDLNEDVTTLTIPCTVNFLDVTEMKATVLSECEAKIGKLILPRTLKNIPRATFSGDTVSEVEVGDNTIIEKGAFTNTTITLNPTNTKYVVEDGVLYDLVHNVILELVGTPSEIIKIREGITDIGTVFAGTPIQYIYLPASVDHIAYGAFADCTSLRGVVSANSYSAYDSIGERAFAGCTALEFIVFPTSLQTISADAFIGTPAIDIYYGGERMGDYNYYLGEDDPSLTGNVYLYSRHELEPEAYREGDDLYWHFDENGMPAQWLNFHDDVSGKTFTVTSAEAKLSEAYWNILVAAKQAGILNQVFAEDSDFYRAAMNSETREEANAAFGEIYGNMFGEMVFSDGNVTVSNSTVTGATFAYHCINDVIFIHNTTDQFEKLYIKDGAIHELDSKPVEGYESCKIDVTFIYTVSE